MGAFQAALAELTVLPVGALVRHLCASSTTDWPSPLPASLAALLTAMFGVPAGTLTRRSPTGGQSRPGDCPYRTPARQHESKSIKGQGLPQPRAASPRVNP